MDNSFMINDVNLYWLLVDDEITDDQLEKIRTLLKTSEDARNHYFRMMNLEILLRDSKGGVEEESDLNPYAEDNLWQMLAFEEKMAPEIIIPPVSNETEEGEQPFEIKKACPPISKFSIISLALSSAALIFMIVYAHFVSMTKGVEVATLTDGMNAKWADIASPMEQGTRIATGNKRWLLREGYAELLFDNQTRVTLEGPVEFQLLTEDRIGLNYGKMYARVPQGAIGFTVDTPSARIVDLGTEFGVEATASGDTYLHMIAGKTMLVAGEKTNKISMEVEKNTAKRISGSTQKISDIPCDEYFFVRSIDSDSKLVWRGRNLNLASLVAGGDGFTPGNPETGIDPSTGQIHPQVIQGLDRFGQAGYRPVPERRFIDGVFIPDGGEGHNIISSTGLMCDSFPDTDSYYWADITANQSVTQITRNGEQNVETHTLLSLDTAELSSTENSSLLLLHPNAGITFDLSEIRQVIANVAEIDSFQAICGVSKNVPEQRQAEFWVFIDGRCVFHYTNDQKLPKKIDIPIQPNQRFLTLATTDSGDQIVYDWCLFVNPELKLVSTSVKK